MKGNIFVSISSTISAGFRSEPDCPSSFNPLLYGQYKIISAGRIFNYTEFGIIKIRVIHRLPKTGDLLSLAATKLEGIEMITGSTQSNFPWKMANLRILMLDTAANISIRKGFALSQTADGEKFDTILLNPPFGGVSNGWVMGDPSGKWSILFNKTRRIDIAFLCHALDRSAAPQG